MGQIAKTVFRILFALLSVFVVPLAVQWWSVWYPGSEPGGGLMARQQPGQSTLMYFDVASIEEYAKKAEALGGKVLAPKVAVADMGWFALIADPQGNTFGIWEVSPDSQPPAQ